MKEIITAFDKTVVDGKLTALASLVHPEGSSYRRPGAKPMLIQRMNIFVV